MGAPDASKSCMDGGRESTRVCLEEESLLTMGRAHLTTERLLMEVSFSGQS